MLVLSILAAITLTIYIFVPFINLQVVRRALGLTLIVDLFYLIGHYLAAWPFPDWLVLLQIAVIIFLGTALGVIFSKLWPIPPKKGFERILRTLLIVIPALGIGVVLQLLLQGGTATQAIYIIFALASWLASGFFVRTE
jgi:hypothetical protein